MSLSHLRVCGFAEDLPLPVRHLDVFQLCQLSDLANMEPLEDVDGISESIVAQGQIIPAGAIAAGALNCHSNIVCLPEVPSTCDERHEHDTQPTQRRLALIIQMDSVMTGLLCALQTERLRAYTSGLARC